MFGQNMINSAQVAGISAAEGDLYLTSDTNELYIGRTNGNLRKLGGITQLTQDNFTGTLSFSDSDGVQQQIELISTDANNAVTAGGDGGVYLPNSAVSTVYMGYFIINATGNRAITGIPFRPSQVSFTAFANVENVGLYSDNQAGNNNSGIANAFGAMEGFARNDGGSITRLAMYIGGSGNSINDISRYSSTSRCIGVRYSNQNGDNLGLTAASLTSFDADGFTLNITNRADNLLVLKAYR
jgi:hypothetical protein